MRFVRFMTNKYNIESLLFFTDEHTVRLNTETVSFIYLRKKQKEEKEQQ